MDNMPLTGFKDQNRNLDSKNNPMEELQPKIEKKRGSNYFEKKGLSYSTEKINKGHKRPKSSAQENYQMQKPYSRIST